MVDKIKKNEIHFGNGQNLNLNGVQPGTKGDDNNSVFKLFDKSCDGQLDEKETAALKDLLSNVAGDDKTLTKEKIENNSIFQGKVKADDVFNLLQTLNQKTETNNANVKTPQKTNYTPGAKDTWYGIAEAKYGLKDPKEIIAAAHQLKKLNNAQELKDMPKDINVPDKINLKSGKSIKLQDINAKVDEKHYISANKQSTTDTSNSTDANNSIDTNVSTTKDSTDTSVNANGSNNNISDDETPVSSDIPKVRIHDRNKTYKKIPKVVILKKGLHYGRYIKIINGKKHYYAHNGIELKASYAQAAELAANTKARHAAISGGGRYSVKGKDGNTWYFAKNGRALNQKYFQKQEVKTICKKQASKYTKQLKDIKSKQGPIGKAWDWFKNTTGIGAGSDKVQSQINRYKYLNKQLDRGYAPEAAYARITGQKVKNGNELQAHLDKEVKFTKKGYLLLSNDKIGKQIDSKMKDYKEGQEQAVDIAADTVAGITSLAAYTAVGASAVATALTGGAAAPLLLLSLAAATGVGAVTKAGVKALDAEIGGREYNTAKDDLVSGAFDGALAPISFGAGGAAAKSVFVAGGKAVAEDVAITTGKEILKTEVKGMATQATKKVLTKTAEEVVENVGTEVVETGAKQTIRESAQTAAKEAAEKAAKLIKDGVSPEKAEKIVLKAAEKAAKKAVQKTSKELAKDAAKDFAASATKSTTEELAKNAGKLTRFKAAIAEESAIGATFGGGYTGLTDAYQGKSMKKTLEDTSRDAIGGAIAGSVIGTGGKVVGKSFGLFGKVFKSSEKAADGAIVKG